MTQPNILFIMADQYRWDFVGAMGADFVDTPNLDRLAARGTMITQCTTNCPICAPARIGLTTGLQPSRLGAVDNSSFLPRSMTTYYQRLRDSGYRVGCVGKLDLAKPDGYNGRNGDRPVTYQWGFTHPEEDEGKMHAGGSPTPLGPYGFWLQEQGLYQTFHEDYVLRKNVGWVDAMHDSPLPTHAFEDVYIGRRAVEWLETIPDDFPWHYFVSFVGPHDPFDPPTEYADRYRERLMPEPIHDTLEGKPKCAKKRDLGLTPEQVVVSRRQYCALISLIDDAIGNMMDALEKRGILDNTIVIFSSDHGEMLGDHGMYTKSTAYEGALRVPLIFAGPGIQQDVISDALAELIDVNPTICAFAGLPQQEDIDAQSLVPLLAGETDSVRSDTVAAMRNFRVIRTEQYKYIQNYNDIDELYDLQADPSELINIAGEKPEIAQALRWRMVQRFTEGQWLR